MRREVAEAGRGRFFSGIVKSEKREKKQQENGEREKNRKMERGKRRKIGK